MTSKVQRGKPFFDKVFSRKKKRSSSTATTGSDFVLPGLRRDQIKKHRSCMVHMLSYMHGQQATREEAQQIEEKFGTACCFFNGIPHGIRSTKSKRAHPVPLQAKDISSDPVPSVATDMRSDPVPSQAKDTSSDPVPFLAKNASSDPVPCEETDTSSDPVPSEATNTSSGPVTSQTTDMSSNPVPCQGTNMSSRSFGDHLERIWKSFPAEKLVQFTYLECLWFGMYRQTSHRNKVLSWIKKRNIFSKSYVFVPICCWSHWNLLILCHFGESLDSENKKPCMLLLDSLHMANPMRLEQDIRKLVFDIYLQEGISVERVSEICLTAPKVLQQKNKECGFFSLYFIKKFMEAAPETLSNGDMSFIDQNWFTREELDGFCIALEEESKAQTELEAMTSQEIPLKESCKGDVIIIND